MATREEYRDIFSHRLTGSLDQYQKSLLSVQILYNLVNFSSRFLQFSFQTWYSLFNSSDLVNLQSHVAGY